MTYFCFKDLLNFLGKQKRFIEIASWENRKSYQNSIITTITFTNAWLSCNVCDGNIPANTDPLPQSCRNIAMKSQAILLFNLALILQVQKRCNIQAILHCNLAWISIWYCCNIAWMCDLYCLGILSILPGCTTNIVLIFDWYCLYTM